MTQEDINKLGDLLTKRNDLVSDSTNLHEYINAAKKQERSIFSIIYSVLNENQNLDYFNRDNNTFSRVIRKNKDILFNCLCNIFEVEEKKISELIDESNAQIEAIQINFGGKE